MTNIITMSKKELDRAQVIRDLINKRIKGKAAAKLLELSARQIKRLKKRYKQSGAVGLIHQSRGQKSHNQLAGKIKSKATKLLKKSYSDFGPTHAMEKLAENHKIILCKETVRQLMIGERLWMPKQERLKAHYRSWRDRREYFGEMQQYDGSDHDWFEGRLPKCTLLAAIDDATGEVTHLRFAGDEGVFNTFTFWLEYMTIHGKPLNIYLDRYSTYKINHQTMRDDPTCLTQFERAMEKDLQIKIIHARSPQAKGRIERLFNTLQNRLPKELRLAKIKSLAEANQYLTKEFLPMFNRRFTVVAKKPGNLHRPFGREDQKSIGGIFSIQTSRVVNNDFTVSLKGIWYQLAMEQPVLVLKKEKVIVEEHLDGSVWLRKNKRYLNYRILPERPKKIRAIPLIGLSREKHTGWKPPANHPWRNSFLSKPVEALTPAVPSFNH